MVLQKSVLGPASRSVSTRWLRAVCLAMGGRKIYPPMLAQRRGVPKLPARYGLLISLSPSPTLQLQTTCKYTQQYLTFLSLFHLLLRSRRHPSVISSRLSPIDRPSSPFSPQWKSEPSCTQLLALLCMVKRNGLREEDLDSQTAPLFLHFELLCVALRMSPRPKN